MPPAPRRSRTPAAACESWEPRRPSTTTWCPATRRAALPNATGITVGGSGNTIGGAALPDRNVVSGNTGTGINVAGTGSHLLRFNFVGTTADGTAALPNGVGISVSSSSNMIGVAGGGNLICGNTSTGVSFQAGANDNSMKASYVGVALSGAALPNGGSGVSVSGSTNVIGGTSVSDRNVISGNGGNGVNLGGTGSHVVRGNYIGVDPAGSLPLPNAGGLAISSPGNLVGGTSAGAGNLVQSVSISSADGNTVQGNLIGLDAAGTASLAGGAGIGVRILDADSNVIGGASAAGRKVI
jgi:hypothetical protein